MDPEVGPAELVSAGLSEERAKGTTTYRGVGCPSCSDTGFKGRVAIYEVMPISDDLREFVLNGASALELKREAMRGGMLTLRQSALNKLADGITTLSEVCRVSAADT